MKTNAQETDEIMYLVQSMAAIPEFPQAESAREAIAEALKELCDSVDQIEKITHEAIHKWRKWRGVPGLRDLRDLENPAPPAGNQAKDYGPRPHVDCIVCNDFGTFYQDRKNHWCECQAGQDLRSRYPHLVDGLNGKRYQAPATLQSAPVRKPITEADLERAFAERQDRTKEIQDRATATLADESSSPDQKEIAREILRSTPLQIPDLDE